MPCIGQIVLSMMLISSVYRAGKMQMVLKNIDNNNNNVDDDNDRLYTCIIFVKPYFTMVIYNKKL
jgi:hypothetical protein